MRDAKHVLLYLEDSLQPLSFQKNQRKQVHFSGEFFSMLFLLTIALIFKKKGNHDE